MGMDFELFGRFLLHQDGGGLLPRGTRVEVFEQIYWVFLVLGTVVGVVVISYMVYNAYRYRAGSGHDDGSRLPLGELPTGNEGGRKLFLSFGLSTIIVVSLIVWTYGTLLYVEAGPAAATGSGDHLEVRVEGYQFGWDFVYPNGHTDSTLRVPEGETVRLVVTSRDVFHNFGIPDFRVKTDAIPGQTTDAWFVADGVGTHRANCYELCGSGHSFMHADVVVMEPGAYDRWYANTTDGSGDGTSSVAGPATGARAASHSEVTA